MQNAQYNPLLERNLRLQIQFNSQGSLKVEFTTLFWDEKEGELIKKKGESLFSKLIGLGVPRRGGEMEIL